MTERDTIWDPLRKREVARTPEEEVRQWLILRLSQVARVPLHMMMSETGFTLGEKQYRADILIWGRDGQPIAIAECKRPDVELDEKVLDQVHRYDMVLNVRYIFISNGKRTLVCRRIGDSAEFEFLRDCPGYEEMLNCGSEK